MDLLLINDFTAHYHLPPATVNNIMQQTAETYFEIEDINKEAHVYTNVGQGTAAYRNNSPHTISIVNYDKFVSSLSHAFQHRRERCDLIVYTVNVKAHFLLNELKDTKPGKRKKAISQLKVSLRDIMVVPTISGFVNGFQDRRCCFFNKRVTAPAPITAPTSFNRLSTIASDGFQMPNSFIESYGFTLWEYSGGKIFVL